MKFVALVAVPPGVVIAIFPVTAPVGTVAVTSISLTTVNADTTPPKVTLVALVKLVPLIVTDVPTFPLGGLKLAITGVTLNFFELPNPPGVKIPIPPVLAPLGTVAVTCVAELTVNVVAFIPPNVTLLACVKPVPVMMTGVPTGPLGGAKLVMAGITRKTRLLTSVRVGVTTVTFAVVPFTGTTAVI